MEPVLDYLSKPFAAVGANQPWQRAALGAVAVGGVMYALQPSWAFDAMGARPWALLAVDGDDRTRATMVPWYLPALVAGFVAGTFL